MAQSPPCRFLEDLSSPRPNPGGGAAAAHCAEVAAALLEKLLAIELRRPMESPTAKDRLEPLLDKVLQIRSRLDGLRRDDGILYENFVAARSKRTAADPADRSRVRTAALESLACPMRILRNADELLEILSEGSHSFKRHLLSDVQVVCELAGAAVEGACHIAAANLNFLSDPSDRETQRTAALEIYRQARTRYRNVRADLETQCSSLD